MEECKNEKLIFKTSKTFERFFGSQIPRFARNDNDTLFLIPSPPALK